MARGWATRLIERFTCEPETSSPPFIKGDVAEKANEGTEPTGPTRADGPVSSAPIDSGWLGLL
jgi:hypothetical protein